MINKNHFFFLFLFLALAFYIPLSNADFNWASVTLDNDWFIGNDSGYTNGLYISFYDMSSRNDKKMTKPDFWVKPLLWSAKNHDAFYTINSYTIGQSMTTPSDITVAVPDDSALPYSGLLFLLNNYITVSLSYAEKFSTTIGVIGPSSGAESSQKFVHKLFGADKPQGWDTQLNDELVFQFERSSLWRSWVSNSGNADFLALAEIDLGTLESSINGAVMIRYGRVLDRSFHTSLYMSTRVANPIAAEKGWYGFLGVQAGYVFNLIYADGNTFRDSRSVDYGPERLSITTGFTYSWDKLFITFAVSDTNILLSQGEEELEDLTSYGTLTFAWQL